MLIERSRKRMSKLCFSWSPSLLCVFFCLSLYTFPSVSLSLVLCLSLPLSLFLPLSPSLSLLYKRRSTCTCASSGSRAATPRRRSFTTCRSTAVFRTTATGGPRCLLQSEYGRVWTGIWAAHSRLRHGCAQRVLVAFVWITSCSRFGRSTHL